MAAASMASAWDSPSSSLWGALGQASTMAQLVGVDALGLVSMVVQAALVARRHRDACVWLAQHVELVGGLLRELELAELMRREATRRPLEQLRAALRRCYALVTACQDCGYLRRLLLGARMADEFRAAQHEIDMFIRLIPLISLVDNSTNTRRVQADEGVLTVVTDGSNRDIRFPRKPLEFTKIRIQGATELCDVGEQPFVGKVDLREQNIVDIEELVELCTRMEKACAGFKRFDFFQIMDATDNFSEKMIVGWGGFGRVYKGQLPGGLNVAIKRADEHAAMLEVNSELQLAKLKHANVIRLLGWCIHGKERILVYEFMQNGSLDRYLCDRTKGPLLNWSKRFKIITGLTEGIVYLHKHSMFWLVHRDLKPHNVLLDCNMIPKIADFGSARALSSDVAEERTSRVVGTSGYKAPEYASRGVYSMKTDVFSFGVLVLVIISGRKNTILDKRGDTVGDLVRDAWRMWKEQRLHELVDPLLGDGYEVAEIKRCAQVALLCAQEDPADRPAMTDVAAMLNSENIISLPIEPKQPAALMHECADRDTASTYMDQSSRTIDITITSSAPMSTRVRIILDPEV
ncbi:putative cysteine-rich receptor-like protein kinase 20 [Hordeum vulgare subsp. vulgare]|uniref:Protein kinase domain-containing protein n=1 Tax=Hordeum vulgare subsp. vulgare TaxID=112509 RepID=A0A8I6YIB2_HORVV|nr:putative cysteine-rich receptor-like protein kinase 20 [Hordeum vulgare subsp. vulgare]